MDSGLGDQEYKMDGSLVLHNEGNEAPDDLLARRLKNRERQRRYRARKRHEADLKKAPVIYEAGSPNLLQITSELLPVPTEPDSTSYSTNFDSSTRVYCPRDWKKDARRASGNGTASPVEDNPLTSHCNTSLSVVGSTRGLLPSRRDWKAEARNKKTSN